ncbi:glycosyltransferase family 39 protein [Paenibacillus pabuli]|uniref:glycosyltransferase family 39 protein n=1 Tax=Paenibacillus pabuli TaxID=1472 RepID=UPI0007841F26|nr:glycosyltransferase family 39 protein [Paenibacillus pabuli]MEC0125556.1 glycosyltransferase family 39 protein [Paenibacillus pabuli]
MSKVIHKSLYLIMLVFVGVFIVSSLFVRAQYNYTLYGDNPILGTQQWSIFIPVIALLLVSGVGLYRLCLKLNKYSPKVVIPVVLLCSLGIQILIIFVFPRVPTDDSQTVLSLAMNMLYNQDYSSFETGGYLHMFPFNYSTVLYLKTLLYLFPDNYLVIKLFNSLFSTVTTLMIYLIYKQLNTKSAERDYGVLIFAATYLPSLFLNNLIYNDVIATAFLTTCLYFLIRFVREKSWQTIVIAAILLAIGNDFRSIGVIVLIAAMLTILLNMRSIGFKKGIASIFVLAILFNVPGWTQNAALKSSGAVSEPVGENSAPVYMWLNMGINLERFGFWDNMESYQIYQRQANYNKAKSTALYKQEIERKLSEASLSDLAQMYYKKMIWTWTEGTYQMDRYGIGNENSSSGMGRGRAGGIAGSYSYTNAVTDLFQGYSVYRIGLLWVVYVMNFLMYCFIFIRLIGGICGKRYDEVPLILIILGFIGFYILWEIKSRYIYPVYPLLVVLSYMGFKDAYNFMFHRKLGWERSSLGKR